MRLRWNSALPGADNQYPSSAYQMVSSFSLIIAIMSAISINHIPSVCIFITITTVSKVLSQMMLSFVITAINTYLSSLLLACSPTSMMSFVVSVLPISLQTISIIILSLHYLMSSTTTSTYSIINITILLSLLPLLVLLPVSLVVSVVLIIR